MYNNDPIAIKNTTGVSPAVYNEPIASYSAAAAEQGTRINDPSSSPITPGRVNQSRESQNSSGYHAGVDQMQQIARVFGMNIKATLAENPFAYGTDYSTGNHVMGKVTRDIPQEDGSVRTEYISRGGMCNFIC